MRQPTILLFILLFVWLVVPAIAQQPVYIPYTAQQATLERQLWDSPVWSTPYQATLTEDEKVAGLSKFWSEAKYNFAFFDKVPRLSWDSLYLATLPKVRAAPTTLAYYQVLQEMCAQLHDGHTNVNLPNAPAISEQYARPPLRTALVEGQVLLTEVRSETLRRQGVIAGVEVVAIDGVPVRQYGEQRALSYSASTPQSRDVRTYTYQLPNGPITQPLALTLRDTKGHTFQRSVARSPYADAEPASQLPPLTFKLLADDIGYLALNSFESNDVRTLFAAVYPQLSQTRALIIDIRENGGGNGNLGYEVLSYLTAQSFYTSRWMTRNYHPTFRAWQRAPRWYSEPVESVAPHSSSPYTRPVVVLTSARTFSAAEDFVVAFDEMKRGKIIGEPTGGSTGQPLAFDLPGGGTARICTKRDTYADGQEFVGVGVSPQVLIHPTVRDVRNGQDTVLRRALEELKAKSK